jgi:hypothetical protein
MENNIKFDKAVFTTKYILVKNHPITCIVRDEDDEWQFLDGSEVTMEDMMIVSMQNILDYDNSIKTILPHLAKGYQALREGKNDDWKLYRLDA